MQTVRTKEIGEKIMESEKIARLSELTAIARERELTPEEQSERQALRNEYRAAVTGSLRAQLNNTTIINPDGSCTKVHEHMLGEKSKKTSGEG